MTRTTMLLIGCLIAGPLEAGAQSFDPDQPFNEALSRRLLESFFKQAMDVIEDHFELSGNLGSEPGKNKEPRSFRFKFYPDGKSQSQEHFTAEGWFGPSADSKHQELHFRFALPNASTDSSSQVLDNVL